MQLIHSKTPDPITQAGFSLLEVLVAIVILSLGILGLAGLQSAALKNAHSAMLRAQAAQYAYDMADRMRANRRDAIEGHYNLTLESPVPLGTTLVDRDRSGWLAQLGSLPNGRGAIVVEPDGSAKITVRWNETVLGNTDPDPACPPDSPAGSVCFVLDTRI